MGRRHRTAIRTFGCMLLVSFSGVSTDGSHVFSGGWTTPSLRLWDAATGSSIRSFGRFTMGKSPL